MENNCIDNNVHYAEQKLSEDKKYAATYLNETDEIRENAIAEIRCWIKESDDLPARIDDFLILRFLRVCKFNLEKTKARIRNYYKQRSNLPKWYKNKDPFRPELQELLDMGETWKYINFFEEFRNVSFAFRIVLPLRKPDIQGRLIFIARGTRHDPRIHKVSDLIKICLLAVEAAIKYYPAASIYGYIVFIDIKDLTARHIFQLQPYVLRNIIYAWQSSYPLRYHKIVVINAPTIFDIVVKIGKSFVTEKLKSRLHVYSHEHCFEDIPANILPVEYGGTDGTIQELIGFWKKLIEENRNWAIEDENDKIE